jgi:hypothetical protein
MSNFNLPEAIEHFQYLMGLGNGRDEAVERLTELLRDELPDLNAETIAHLAHLISASVNDGGELIDSHGCVCTLILPFDDLSDEELLLEAEAKDEEGDDQ